MLLRLRSILKLSASKMFGRGVFCAKNFKGICLPEVDAFPKYKQNYGASVHLHTTVELLLIALDKQIFQSLFPVFITSSTLSTTASFRQIPQKVRNTCRSSVVTMTHHSGAKGGSGVLLLSLPHRGKLFASSLLLAVSIGLL